MYRKDSRFQDLFDSCATTMTDMEFGIGGQLVAELIEQSVVLSEDWDECDESSRVDIFAARTQPEALEALISRHLITEFQGAMIAKGCSRDLVLGHYRLLEPVGRGGMGVVYRAENTHLRREVAVKIISNSQHGSHQQLRRFYAEARAVARLHHPNITACFDAGRDVRSDSTAAIRDYYVMELVVGQDLCELVKAQGPLPVARTCAIFRQLADALSEAHRHGLVHRDIKPSNLMITPDWVAKVLDFGLALHPRRKMTEPGTLLGTVGYMAPEQARDAHAVDARADLFSLGASMYWALTGREPFPDTGDAVRDLHQRLTCPAPEVQRLRPELPDELGTLINRMLSLDPDNRPPSARVVALTLAGLSKWAAPRADAVETVQFADDRPRVLVVDDEPALRKLIRLILGDEFAVTEASDGAGLAAAAQAVDLVILDMNLPGVAGPELLEALRDSRPEGDRPMVLLVSGVVPPESLAGLLASGADDFLPKPFTKVDLRSRVRGLIERKVQGISREAERSTQLIGMAGLTLEHVPAPSLDAVASADKIGLLTQMLGYMMRETLPFGPSYADRMGQYVRALAGAVPDRGEYARLKDERFLDLLVAVAPIHDMGLLAIPSSITLKPSSLDAQERMVMQTHTAVAAEWLDATVARNTDIGCHLTLAAEIVRSHHERWDGAGYPDGMAGEAIPLGAGVVALASVYDALRSRRPYRPSFNHARVIRMLSTELSNHFDPVLVAAMTTVAQKFDKIRQSSAE